MGYYAGFVTRLAAFALDVVIISVIVVFVTWFLSTSITMLQLPQIFKELAERSPIVDALVRYVFTPLVGSLVTIAFVIGYHLFFWMLTGQTPGKYIMGLRVVSVDGKKLRLVQAIARYAGYYVSGAALGLGFLWILVDDNRRSWHDRMAHTCVIYSWDARPDENFLVHITGQMAMRIKLLRNMIARRRGQKVHPASELPLLDNHPPDEPPSDRF